MRRAGPVVALDPDRELAELREYLGTEYDDARLRRYEDQLEEEFHRVQDEAVLYRTSQAYLYDLTAFAMTGTKVPYHRQLIRALPDGGRLLDYGCGIGSDGLMLIDAGYDVEFADFDNPSVSYLRWRLARRGVEARIYDLDRDRPSGDFDLAYAFDVIEHVEDPFGFLDQMEEQARMVLVNFLEPEPGETGLHHELPIADLLRRTAQRRIRSYRIHHGRSHLVLYESARAQGVERWRSSMAVTRGRLARRVPGLGS